eukprot:jgi/Botrbrau1/20840/Bobra.0156s0065.1
MTSTSTQCFPVGAGRLREHCLDLNSPSSFRDLTKPLEGRSGCTAFHYGSHYSSAGTVLFYLIRQEPFTALNRHLQGGRFDYADRLFHSMAATWRNCLEGSSDVKELIPEFFYQPDFLINSNHFNLGTRQGFLGYFRVLMGEWDGAGWNRGWGTWSCPPWAAGSPDEFVRVHREALESDYVSERLGEWIDLVFGYKQRGAASEAAANVFYYLTYEGAVDLHDFQDPPPAQSSGGSDSHFGQTPSQLFRKKHAQHCSGPARGSGGEGGAGECGPSRLPSPLGSPPVTRCRSRSRGMTEGAYGMEADPAPPRLLGMPFATDLDPTHCYAILGGAKVVAGGGYWDNSIRCYSVDDGRLLQSLRLHKDIVTCLALASDDRSLVSGSRDTTLIIWDVVGRPRGRVRGAAPLPAEGAAPPCADGARRHYRLPGRLPRPRPRRVWERRRHDPPPLPPRGQVRAHDLPAGQSSAGTISNLASGRLPAGAQLGGSGAAPLHCQREAAGERGGHGAPQRAGRPPRREGAADGRCQRPRHPPLAPLPPGHFAVRRRPGTHHRSGPRGGGVHPGGDGRRGHAGVHAGCPPPHHPPTPARRCARPPALHHHKPGTHSPLRLLKLQSATSFKTQNRFGFQKFKNAPSSTNSKPV